MSISQDIDGSTHHLIHLILRGILGVSQLIALMLYIWIKVAKVTACVLFTGYTQVLKLDAVATMVIHSVIRNCVKLLTKLLSHRYRLPLLLDP